MVSLAEARSFNDGIEFYANKKNLVIISKRNEKGEIVVKTSEDKELIDKGDKRSKIIVSILSSIIFVIMRENIENVHLQILFILAIMWGAVFLWYYIESKNPKNYTTHKYHAAEHKVLNYVDKYKKIPESCEQIAEMPSISIRCGSTLIAVIGIFVSLVIIGMAFIPRLILKIVWCIISIVITFFLWGFGKCNFLQKFVIIEPGKKEVEVAFYGVRQYLEIKE